MCIRDRIKAKGHILMFVIDKALFGLNKDVLYVCTYVPPEGSAYCEFLGEEGNGISWLENTLFDYALQYDDFLMILCGDLNGRTSSVSQPVSINDNFFNAIHSSGSCSVGRIS